MQERLLKGFSLGDVDVRPLAGQVEGPAGVHHLQPKAMDVLVRLAMEPGRVVDRSTLLADVWGVNYPSVQPLTRCISELRQALGDDPHEPRFVQTLPKRGYRLLATPTFPEVVESGDCQEAETPRTRGHSARVAALYIAIAWVLVQVAETVFPALGLPDWTLTFVVVLLAFGFPLAVFLGWATTPSARGPEPSRMIVIASLSVVVAAAAYGGWRLLHDASTSIDGDRRVPEPTMRAPTLAVLPFGSLSQGSADVALATGLAEELTNRLLLTDLLRVASWRSASYHAGKGGDLPSIADRLGVESVLEGTVRRDGDTVTVAVSLSDGEGGLSIWAESFTAEGEAVSRVTDRVAGEVLLALGMVLTDPGPLERTATGLDAYDLYLQGRQLMREPKTRDVLDAAEDLFMRSLALDGAYAPAQAAICELAVHRYQRAGGPLTQAEQACKKAYELDPDFAETNAARGSLFRLTGRLPEAELAYESALAAFPRLIEAQYGLGQVYQAANRLEEAERAFEAAIAIDPSYWGSYTAMGHFLVDVGRGNDALPYYQRVVELRDDSADAWTSLGVGFMDVGRDEEAAEAFLRSIEIRPTVFAYVNLGGIYFGHRMADAVEAFREATKIAPDVYWTWGELAEAAAFRPGQESSAQASLETAIALAEQATVTTPADAIVHADLARYYSQAGRLEEALASADRAIELAPRSPDAHASRALVLTRSSRMDEGLASLEEAVSLGYNPTYLAADPRWDALRSTRRFMELNYGSDESTN